MKKDFHLGQLSRGESAIILSILEDCSWDVRQRLLDLGFVYKI